VEIAKDLEKFLIAEIAVNLDPAKKSITPTEDLISTGLIDSLGIIKLVSFIETKYGIKVNNDEIVPEYFQSLNALAEFVAKKINK
jgi:acyl carrier protein